MTHTVLVFILRVLKKLSVLKYLTLDLPVVFGEKRVTIPIRREIGYPNLFIEEDFLFVFMRLFLPTQPGAFVDVGTNIGQTLLKTKTADRNRKYIGFEPNRVCFEYTTNLIRLNGYRNCEIRNYALSDSCKRVKLALNEPTDAAASMVDNLRPDYFNDSVLIDCIPFDESGITEPLSMVKIDVEGAELEVILGMQKAIATFHPLILCEVLDCYSPEVLQFTQDRADCLCRLLAKHEYLIFQVQQDRKRIKTFRLVETIPIRLWSPASYTLNDYLFCHAEHKQGLVQLLNQLLAV